MADPIKYETGDEDDYDDITELFTGDENDPDAPGYLRGTAMMRQ